MYKDKWSFITIELCRCTRGHIYLVLHNFLLLYCPYAAYYNVTHSQISAPPMSELSDDLGMLVNNDMFSDVKLWADGQCFFGHRAILSARSSYFESMFCSGMRESEQADVKIPDVNAEVFLAVLSFIYTNTVNCPPSLYVRLIRGETVCMCVYIC